MDPVALTVGLFFLFSAFVPENENGMADSTTGYLNVRIVSTAFRHFRGNYSSRRIIASPILENGWQTSGKARLCRSPRLRQSLESCMEKDLDFNATNCACIPHASDAIFESLMIASEATVMSVDQASKRNNKTVSKFSRPARPASATIELPPASSSCPPNFNVESYLENAKKSGKLSEAECIPMPAFVDIEQPTIVPLTYKRYPQAVISYRCVGLTSLVGRCVPSEFEMFNQTVDKIILASDGYYDTDGTEIVQIKVHTECRLT